MANNVPSNQVGGPSSKPPDPGLVMQPQVNNQGQQHPICPANQPQSRQQLLSQNIQNNIASQPNLPPVSSLGQNSNMQNIAGHNSVGSTVGHNSNMQNIFTGSQRQMQERQQVVSQQQQPPQNKLKRQKLQHQQQQQNLLQLNQLQSSQQSVMQQPSIGQTSSLSSSTQRNHKSNNVQQAVQSMHQQHPQVIRQQQTSMIHQQQTPMNQQSILPPQQQQLIKSNVHQQLGNNVPGLQPQQVLGSQSGNSGMLPSQHSAHVLQQSKVPMPLQSKQNASNLLQSQAQQSQPKAPQQQLMPQIQSQPAQLREHLGLQQQPNPLQQDMQQRLQASGSLLQQQSVLDHQKQLYQSQIPLPETSSTSLDSTAQTGQPNGGDWQEEVYQKIKIMKENYLPELNEMYQKIVTKLQQHDSLTQDKLEKYKVFKMMLERIISFLLVSKSNIVPSYKEKLGSYEEQIINFITTNRPRKDISSLQHPGHTNGGDWQEEVYEKIKIMKEKYLPELNEMYQKIVTKLQQHDSLAQDKLEKYRVFKMMLERITSFLQVSKSNIVPRFKEKLGSYEEQIRNLITINRPRKGMSSLQHPGHLPPHHTDKQS